ncbi:MAG: hypothetical protein GY814_05300 [Gammaproteobacteria bacterium]|nr:hypothetical protein [Gammaproteobacteria bacterium]
MFRKVVATVKNWTK